jgi:hypothetical protein
VKGVTKELFIAAQGISRRFYLNKRSFLLVGGAARVIDPGRSNRIFTRYTVVGSKVSQPNFCNIGRTTASRIAHSVPHLSLSEMTQGEEEKYYEEARKFTWGHFDLHSKHRLEMFESYVTR